MKLGICSCKTSREKRREICHEKFWALSSFVSWGKRTAKLYQRFHGIFHGNFHPQFQEKISRQHFCNPCTDENFVAFRKNQERASKSGSILGRKRGLVNNCSAAPSRAPNSQHLSLQSNLKHGWFTRKFANHIWTPRFVWIFCLSPLFYREKPGKFIRTGGFRCGSRTFAWTSHVSDWIVGRGAENWAPPRGRQLYFTFPIAPDPLFKASKAPFLTSRVAIPPGAPRQALLEWSIKTVPWNRWPPQKGSTEPKVLLNLKRRSYLTPKILWNPHSAPEEVL